MTETGHDLTDHPKCSNLVAALGVCRCFDVPVEAVAGPAHYLSDRSPTNASAAVAACCLGASAH